MHPTNPPPVLTRWRFGEVEIVRIVELEQVAAVNAILFEDCPSGRVLQHPWLVPHHAAADGSLHMNFQAFAVRAGGRRIMVDTCIGNDKERQAPLFHRLQGRFLEHLEAAGFAPGTIDTVLCTHLHLDHVGWNTRWQHGRWVPTFPNARYLFSRRDLEFLRAQAGTPGAELEHLADSLEPVLEAGLVQFVEPDHRLCAEVGLLPTPGHTPGHVSVVIESGGASVIITGDVMHHPIQCAEPDLRTRFCADHAQSLQTRRALLRHCEQSHAFVIGSHFCSPTGGWIVRKGDAWRFVGDDLSLQPEN